MFEIIRGGQVKGIVCVVQVLKGRIHFYVSVFRFRHHSETVGHGRPGNFLGQFYPFDFHLPKDDAGERREGVFACRFGCRFLLFGNGKPGKDDTFHFESLHIQHSRKKGWDLQGEIDPAGRQPVAIRSRQDELFCSQGKRQ